MVEVRRRVLWVATVFAVLDICGYVQSIRWIQDGLRYVGIKQLFAYVPWLPSALTGLVLFLIIAWLVLSAFPQWIPDPAIAAAPGPDAGTAPLFAFLLDRIITLEAQLASAKESVSGQELSAETVEPFRVQIYHLSFDGRSGAMNVVAHIKIKNVGPNGGFVTKWQMLYSHNGLKQKEAGKQELQGPANCLEEYRIESAWRQRWSFDDQILMITNIPFASDEEREGFFWAQVDSPISERDLRTIRMQYQTSDNRTFESRVAGASVNPGTLTLT